MLNYGTLGANADEGLLLFEYLGRLPQSQEGFNESAKALNVVGLIQAGAELSKILRVCHQSWISLGVGESLVPIIQHETEIVRGKLTAREVLFRQGRKTFRIAGQYVIESSIFFQRL